MSRLATIGIHPTAQDGKKAEESIADAAYATQELDAVKTALRRAPRWAPGDGLVADMLSAVSVYGTAIDYLRYAFRGGGAQDWSNQASRFLQSGDQIVARAVKTLGANTLGNSVTDRYNAFLDHAKLALKQAYAWFDKLRVAHNLVNNQEALGIAGQMADWAQAERNWLIQHPTVLCYRPLKDHYLSLVITPANLIGRNYVRWAALWPADDPLAWADLTSAVSSFGDGYKTFSAELKNPAQACVQPTPTKSPAGT